MPGLPEIIRTHHVEILESWTREAQRAAAARGLSRPEFRNIIPAYLSALAEAGADLGKFVGQRREYVENHFSSRLRQGFSLAEIVDEFALLGRCIAAMWNADGQVEAPEHAEIEQLFEELHRSSVAVTDMFTQHMMADEQGEKKYQRLIQAVAREAVQPDAAGLRVRLKEVLALVMEAMGAQSTALLLYSSANQNLEIAASFGVADEELEHYVSTLDPSSFPGLVAAREETTSLLDAATTELKVSDTLRRSGIHALLGLRLPPQQRLVGVIYVGISEERAFTPREVRRLESLGQQLTLHLENAKLYGDLREHIERQDAERELRERFVAILAHDLRGPLSAAKMSAQVLIHQPERLDERRDLALRIDRNLDRIDRMIRDLLDANRIRAGERLPLRLDQCDLGAVWREVFEELVATYGERFVFRADDRVMGFWSAEELRRSLWNLATNAVKYGSADSPITITVRSTEGGAQASVHNWGAAISPEDQKKLFRPFSRTQGAQIGTQRGWGLGLTLVHGCAVAHGGRVGVESSKESGTTFTLELPRDSRPFQPRPEAPAAEVGVPLPPALH